MISLGRVGKSEIGSMVYIRNALKKNGLADPGEDVVVFRPFGGENIALYRRDKGNEDVTDILLRADWPVYTTGNQKAYKINIPAFFDIPYTMWGFCHKYVERGVCWAEEEDKKVSIVCEPFSKDYLSLYNHVIPTGAGWRKVGISPGLLSAFNTCDAYVGGGGSLSRISMDGGEAVFSVHNHNSDGKYFKYGSVAEFDRVMESIVSELDSKYSKLDISTITWYNSIDSAPAHLRGYVKSLGNGEYEFLIL